MKSSHWRRLWAGSSSKGHAPVPGPGPIFGAQDHAQSFFEKRICNSAAVIYDVLFAWRASLA
jgi:hypothetical protein